MCSSPTNECRAYIAGFVQALEAYDEVLRETGQLRPKLYCLPVDGVEIEDIRVRIVSELSSNKSEPETGYRRILLALHRSYPCKP